MYNTQNKRPPALAMHAHQPLRTLVEFTTRHPRLFVLSGAGCSADSGIPTYRDGNGDWMRPAPITFQAFTGDDATRRRYWARSLVGWPTMAHARPGAAHQALAQLEAAGRIELLLTLNPAVTPPPAAPPAVLAVRSSGQCDHRYSAADKPNDPAA